MSVLKEIAAGVADSWILAGAVVAVVFGGGWRAMKRLAGAFIRHEPLPIGPDRNLRTN